jgi:hypothetical protein
VRGPWERMSSVLRRNRHWVVLRDEGHGLWLQFSMVEAPTRAAAIDIARAGWAFEDGVFKAIPAKQWGRGGLFVRGDEALHRTLHKAVSFLVTSIRVSDSCSGNDIGNALDEVEDSLP